MLKQAIRLAETPDGRPKVPELPSLVRPPCICKYNGLKPPVSKREHSVPHHLAARRRDLSVSANYSTAAAAALRPVSHEIRLSRLLSIRLNPLCCMVPLQLVNLHQHRIELHEERGAGDEAYRAARRALQVSWSIVAGDDTG